MGSYKVVFPAEGTAADGDTLTGALTDNGRSARGERHGAVEQEPQLPGHRIDRDASRARRPDIRAAGDLGEPAEQGRRQFSIEGTM